ncbi:MAG: hypothetical protein ACI85O_001183 [Saprospiraceae bacterium]|jgi:hypothetical protein
MKLNTLEKHINLNVSLSKGEGKNNEELKIVLIEPTIMKGTYNYYQEIHLDLGFIGSKLFMGSENDIMCFSLQTQEMNALDLRIPYGVILAKSNFDLSKTQQVYDLKIDKVEDFFLVGCEKATYYKNDFLLLSYEDDVNFREVSNVRLADNLFVFVKNEVIIGWGVSNCTSLLYSLQSKRFDEYNPKNHSLLNRFFLLHNEEMFEKINEKDLNLKKVMLQLIKDSKEGGCHAIAEALEEWLDF